MTARRFDKPWILILAGGSGTRFWPASRRAAPKHVIAGLGGEGRSLLQATIDRAMTMTEAERVFVVTAADQVDVITPHCQRLSPGRIIAEPVPKNTGPAVALSLIYLSRAGATAHEPVVVLPADAWVGDEGAFATTVSSACAAAVAEKAIVTLGVSPTHPATGYGWIEAGEGTEVEGATVPVLAVESFVEKPDAEVAADLLAGGRHLWNAGIFAFRFGYLWWLLGDLDEQWDLALTMMSACIVDGDQAGLAAEYEQFESISLDHSVIERAPTLLCVEATFGWSDLGSWDSVGDVLDELPGGRGRAGRVIANDADRNVVFAPGKAVALLGVEDLVVVATDDAILVAPRDRAQDVKALVAAAVEAGEDDLL